jgi:hypothetical protein
VRRAAALGLAQAFSPRDLQLSLRPAAL